MPKKFETSCHRKPKHKPYGRKGTNPYCNAHDQHMNYNVNKKTERQKSKLQIKKYRED